MTDHTSAADGVLTGAESDVLGTFDVSPEPDGVRRARAFCLQTLAAVVLDPDTDDVVGDAEMITSELVTNAVRAEASRIVLEIARVGDTVRISVLDDAAGEVAAVQPEPLGLSGRGLRIVDTLATRWGVQPWPGAKTVWADLTLPTSSKPREEPDD